MPSLRERVDLASLTVTFLPLPKNKKRGSAVGFCGHEPVALIDGAGNTAPPYRWVNGKPEVLTYQDVKKIGASGASRSQVAGLWYTPKHDERALVWTRDAAGLMSGVELHPSGWDKSNALACSDTQQVGYGYEKFAKNPCRALLWEGTRESLVVLTGPDPSIEVYGKGVAGGVQVGYVGGSRMRHACLWRGTAESFVDLHPGSDRIVGSDAMGIGDGQQVGHVWDDEMAGYAALWSGTAQSYVNLAPKGFVRSTAWTCARGLQVGWAGKEDRGMLVRAILWNGSADDFLDLQEYLPAPWNVSQALALNLGGGRLRILGTAQQAVQSGGYEMDAGKVPVIWELKLLVPEAPEPSVPVSPGARAVAGAVLPSVEQRIAQAADAFGQAIVERDFKRAHAMLAPWLRKAVTAKRFQAILDKHRLADVALVDCVVTGNDSTLDELRAHYHEYHKDDPTRTLATAQEFGAYGPPSIVIDPGVTPANFRQWLCLDFTPDPDGDSGLDYCLRLWLIIVEIEGAMQVGHCEPED